MDIKGRNVLITGASRGIGQQIAIGCAKEGANLLLHARKIDNLKATVELVKEYGVDEKCFEAELSDMAQVDKLISDVTRTGVDVEILYNDAAIMTPWISDVWDCPIEDWISSFYVNVFAMVKICNAFIPSMIERGFGRIINTTSGIEGTPELAAYGASKAAVDKYTKEVSVKLDGTGVLINTLDPGWLKTDLGGPEADHEVTSVLPGALVGAKLENHSMNGEMISAQKYREV